MKRLFIFIIFISLLIIQSLMTDVMADNIGQNKDVSESPIEHFASEYYRIVEIKKNKSIEYGTQSERTKKKTMPKSVNGRVIDRKGHPVAGVRVVVEKGSGGRKLGRGVTDENGYFNIKLKKTSYKGLSLTITKKKYARWAVSGFYGGIVNYAVQIDREIDKSYLKAITEQVDYEERLWMLFEVIGSRTMGSLDVEDIYPFLGDMRQDLIAVIRSGLFDRKDDKWSSPSERAKSFLEFWYDPADESSFTKLPSIDISGQTINEVCKKYSDCHFKEEKVEERTFNAFSLPIFGSDEKHALVTFHVEYKHWGYSQILALYHDGKVWRLVIFKDHMHWDRDI